MGKLRGGWYGLVMAGGLGFGLIGERRPFGTDMLTHPLVVYFATVALGLLILRVVLGRPVPEVIPERVLVAGCWMLERRGRIPSEKLHQCPHDGRPDATMTPPAGIPNACRYF
jgi:hypothetical protein